MTPQAFGRFVVGGPSPPRRFELEFEIPARDGPDAWRSGLPSVQRLLDHLRRYTQSEASRETYLRHLLQFCRWSGLGPEELARLPKGRAERLVQGFVDELARRDASRAYVNTVLKRLRTFFRVNGYTGRREPRLQTYFVPTRYRKKAEYIPSKDEVFAMADAAGGLRDRAIVLVLWSSGLRVSTLCALNYGDVAEELGELEGPEELETRGSEPCTVIPVFPEMKRRVPDACKGQIPYYTFICPEAGEALKGYLRERRDRYGPIGREDPLFHSDWTLWLREARSTRRLGRRAVGLIVKRAARLAGIKQWRHVTPHCLRKAFESILVSPTVDGGRLDNATQEFFMGHILPGSQEFYYDKTRVEFHRREYSRLDFSRGGASAKTVDRLIDVAGLDGYLDEGWMFVAKIDEGRVVVRRRG